MGLDNLTSSTLTNLRRKAKFVDEVYKFEDGQPMFSWLDINVTELCNRRCVFCPRVDSDRYPNQKLHMTVELATKIALELKQYSYKGGVVFSGYSEPLLHPEIVAMVKPFSGLNIEIVTNGDPLTEDLVRELYGAGLTYMVVSMYDGPHQRDAFESLFESAGISGDRYILRDRWYDESDSFGLKLTNRAGNIETGIELQETACFYTHYSMMIDWNGDVLLCVQDWNKKVKFGNLQMASLYQCWTSTGMRKYRSTLGKGFRKRSPCDVCDVNGKLHGSSHKQAWDAYAQE